MELIPPFRIVRLDRVESTMTAAAGRPPGTVVVAEEQTAGQGRMGRSWYSPRGEGLYCSIVLSMPEPAPVLTLALGLAAKEAIERTAAAACDLRWPNDVLLAERKVAGVLVQLQETGAIAGVGINVSQAAFPPELAPHATSLRLATGTIHSREALLAHLLDAVRTFTGLLASEGAEAILRLFSQASSYVFGRRVVVEGTEGVTDGLDPSGFLWLRTARGRQLIRAGNVRPV
jgi:BirA family biotin operon repressor/biotin-[acetyl-CoA-carboxylase] ligase